jgi:hypothetical protein
VHAKRCTGESRVGTGALVPWIDRRGAAVLAALALNALFTVTVLAMTYSLEDSVGLTVLEGAVRSADVDFNMPPVPGFSLGLSPSKDSFLVLARQGDLATNTNRYRLDAPVPPVVQPGLGMRWPVRHSGQRLRPGPNFGKTPHRRVDTQQSPHRRSN